MPDIQMCANDDCPMNYVCYRYRAIPNKYWQGYGKYTPKGGNCKGFYAVVGRDMIRSMEEIRKEHDSNV